MEEDDEKGYGERVRMNMDVRSCFWYEEEEEMVDSTLHIMHKHN